jgi:N-acetylmuramoyl-L-alanine amidase
MIYLTTIQNQYANVYGTEIWNTSLNGVTLEDNVKETVLARIAQIKTMYLLAKEKEVALSVARQAAQLMEDRQVKVYLTRTEDTDVTKEARRQFADWVGADLYLEIGLSSDPENTSVYGISGEYNDEYYIPEFGNLQWADCVTRQVTVAASNRAVGLFPATEEDVLWEIAIPSARISLGYVTNAAERQLLIQEDYQKKLAQGIAEAINEVYTNTQ